LAEYVVSEEKYLARMPEAKQDPSLAFEYAASLPRAALTAWQALKIQMGGVVKPGMSEFSKTLRLMKRYLTFQETLNFHVLVIQN
jgi:NADPH:quinone reductase-like Zn-dependent oxidoreductase